jgi:hypothetical protein
LQDWNIKTRCAEQQIKFGRAVFVGSNPGSGVKNAFKSKASVTYSADFIASNSIPMAINGVAITPIVYATSHAATFTALIAAIDALDGVSAVAGAGREIIISVDNATSNITISDSSVSGGSSQPTLTIAYSSSDLFEGIAVLRHGQPTVNGGDDKYEIDDVVNVLTKGDIWIEAVASVNYGDSVYIYNDKSNPSNQGQFTNSSSGNILVSGAKFVSAASGSTNSPALARIEINQPA